MAQWHCSVGGQQYGPISEEELRSWAAQGRVKATDLVWTEGMAEWAPASSVQGLLPATLAQAGPVARTYARPHRGGTVLALGIVGIVSCFICGIIAWVMGNNDLREISAGRMDPSGRDITNAGRICGIIGTILGLLGCAWGVVWVLFVFGMGGLAHMR